MPSDDHKTSPISQAPQPQDDGGSNTTHLSPLEIVPVASSPKMGADSAITTPKHNNSTAKKEATPITTSPPSNTNALVGQATYEYIVSKNIPSLIDGLCARLAEERPEDPVAFLVGHLNGERAGGYRGGVAVAGTSVGGGWLRTFDATGRLLGVVDRLPLVSEGELNLLVACPNTKSIFIAGPATSTSGGAPNHNTVVRRFSWSCELLATYPIGKPISCIGLDKERGQLWVLFRGGSGCVVQVSSGSIMREVSLPPATGVYVVKERSQGPYIWLLSPKCIEKRDVDTLQLEASIHLPDSMLKPTTFTLSESHLWCASSSSDGSSANFCSAFERSSGKAAPGLIAPTGSIVAYDPMRGGTWHMPIHSSNSFATFLNSTGTKLMSVNLKVWRKANLVVDRARGSLWLYCADEGGFGGGGGCRVVNYDPMACTVLSSHEVPEIAGNTTLMVPL